MIIEVISGGQTGVDRAALDVAIKLGISHRGWCPRGRIAEDGVITDKYQLRETASANYSERTKLNVKDSDGTLIILDGEPTGGTQLAIDEAIKLDRPLLLFNIAQNPHPHIIGTWIQENKITSLNIAGPRASQDNKIYEIAYLLLNKILKQL